ncbi:hypothetical protein QBC34DRAFT_78717 [Podospora aff. communis PSN243]|uniref:Uncharacterized protein n=1 Tax=Podospora aff. communis PSN243 TaxID=3040156 RepID=A0AAV9GSN4_9PEZI|nr:hypothetical protein QBC34DRAFT_78717 [Podospora aff. communis PSN243]
MRLSAILIRLGATAAMLATGIQAAPIAGGDVQVPDETELTVGLPVHVPIPDTEIEVESGKSEVEIEFEGDELEVEVETPSSGASH